MFGAKVFVSVALAAAVRGPRSRLRVIADWLDRYHADRPHSALGYLTPNEYQGRLAA